MVDERAGSVTQFPATLNADVQHPLRTCTAGGLKVELNLELAEAELDQRRADETAQVKVVWNAAHLALARIPLLLPPNH